MLTAIIAIIAIIVDIVDIVDIAPAVAAATLAPAAWTRITSELRAIRHASAVAAAAYDCAESLILADELDALMLEIDDAGETRATVTAPALLHPTPQHYLGALNPHYDNR